MIPPKTLRTLTSSARWSTLVRADERLVSLANWDAELIRQPRVLVPIDVQALYVPASGGETFVRLPFATTTPDGADPAPMPPPFAAGAPRPPGVHVHWAMPDSLLSGKLEARDPGSANRLSLPALPDRWVVLRLAIPRGEQRARVTGWVIEADKTRVTPLADWPQPDKARPATGKTIAPDALTGSVGGTLNWSGCYDAVANRFSFHDDLADLAAIAPRGMIGDFASYVVCGWWSSARLDPLDSVTDVSLYARLEALAWRLADDVEDRGAASTGQEAKLTRQSSLSLASASRYKAFAREGLVSQELKSGAAAAIGGLFAESAAAIGPAIMVQPQASLLHGVIHGVPVSGAPVADQRPSPREMKIAFGFHTDDLASVFAARGIALAKPGDRRDVERLVSGFSHNLLSGLATTNGIFAIEEEEHGSAFSSRSGGPGPFDRLLEAGTGDTLPGTRASRSAVAGARLDKTVAQLQTKVFWSQNRQAKVQPLATSMLRVVQEQRDIRKAPAKPPASRLVQRPMPRFFAPLEPLLAVSGIKRHLRHRHDTRRSSDARLRCRWPSQAGEEIAGLVHGRDLVAPFPAGGLPPEVTRLVNNAIITDPYIAPWRGEAVAGRTGMNATAVANRMVAETALRFTKDGSFGAGGVARSLKTEASPYRTAQITAELNRFSLIGGVDPDPVAVTAWSQPWVPLWLEWEVEIDATDRLEGWSLGEIDLKPAAGEDPPAGTKRTIAGRSPLHTGVAATLGDAIKNWLNAEDERDRHSVGEVDVPTAEQLAAVASEVDGIDILAASLDTIHDTLLGLPVGPYGVLRERQGDTIAKPVPVALPQLLLAGRLTVTRARIVDAFGRTLDLPAADIVYPARDALDGGSVLLRPRLLRPARWLFRLTDPAEPGDTPREATIDQLEPKLMVNPVAGFLLPDHIDEALELFDTAGSPLGQLSHDPVTGGVGWEIAPGRDVPPGAGPFHDLAPTQHPLGEIVAAVVASDAQERRGLPADADVESALSAFLRAIDTTLWTVDTYSVLGSTHVAGLVGRPIAVARAILRLDIDDDLDELDLTDPVLRREAYDDLADRAFPVRIGEMARDDDGVLGFFVDDDYSRYHVVDKAVRDGAIDGGRGRGQLGMLGAGSGTGSGAPATRTIVHPFIVAEDEIIVRPGQTVRLTILMHPGGKCHLTSGVLPRKALQLSRDWIHDGLAAIAPSARVGPVLIDADKVRLPLIASFGPDQLWTRREGNYAWKDDPILAATQTALLPEMPATVEEGYIRIAPVKPADKAPK